MIFYAVLAVVTLAGLLLSWFVPSWLRMAGTDALVLRIGLGLIALLCGAAAAWYWHRRRAAVQPGTGDAGTPGPVADEVDGLLRAAQAKLDASPARQKSRLAELPVVVVVGESGSTKTSCVVNSSLDAELLAGQAYQETTIIPTKSANLWLARGALFVEASGRLLSDTGAWRRLVARLSPPQLGRVFGKGVQPPRAAVVCVSCDLLLKPGASEAAAAAARELRARLTEMASSLGVQLPTYVLFTKADRIPFFHDFVRNYADAEWPQALGVRLPVVRYGGGDVYAERESNRLSEAFHAIFLDLDERRTEMLTRENDEKALGAIYEFPREFRKLRSVVVQFLVELGLPSQLSSGPYVRGFYFGGVRPVIVNEVVGAPARRAQEPAAGGGDATSIFRAGQAVVPEAPPRMEAKKRPQWVFLPHFFARVLLADRDALAGSTASARTGLLRKALLIAASCLILLMGVLFAISWAGNRGLEKDVLEAAGSLSQVQVPERGAPPGEALSKLDGLRSALVRLEAGPSLWLRWGLSTSEALAVEGRRIYFRQFRRMLLNQTQEAMIDSMRALPPAPAPGDVYDYVYDTLKGYLITTAYAARSTRPFLPGVLLERWKRAVAPDAGQEQLAARQFDYYAAQLPAGNPFPATPDTSIDKARAYLKLFTGSDRVYRAMLDEGNRANPGISFEKRFPDAAKVVTVGYEVPGAFTKGGWTFMQNAIKNAPSYFGREDWVLGPDSAGGTDLARLDQDLRSHYRADFIRYWREYLKRARVLPYADLKDASSKLGRTASPQSPVLAVMWLAAQNTGVDDPQVKAAFQPLFAVEPPSGSDQLISAPNKPWVDALLPLQVSLEQLASQPKPPGPGDPAAAQTVSQAGTAKLVARQLSLGMGTDAEGHIEETLLKLLVDPITNAESLLRTLGPAELNAKGRALCAQLGPLFRKYPFSPSSQARATLDDVNAVFKPASGAFWSFYEENLKKLLVKQGNSYAPSGGAPLTITANYQSWFNRMAAFSQALYAGGPDNPKLTYSVRPMLTADVEAVSVTIDGKAAQFNAAAPNAQSFQWPGAGGVRINFQFKAGTQLPLFNYDGLWAAFDFFGGADSASGGTFEWRPRIGRPERPIMSPVTNQPLVVRLEVTMPAGAPVFQRGFLGSLACVSDIAR